MPPLPNLFGYPVAPCECFVTAPVNAYRSVEPLSKNLLRSHRPMYLRSLIHFVFGEKHFKCLISEYVEDYHTERPHQVMGNVMLSGTPPAEDEPPDIESVVCGTRLGWLLKHYQRRAA